MTLNEFIEAVSKLKGWKSVTGVGGLGFEVPQAAGRRQFVAKMTDESGAALPTDASRRPDSFCSVSCAHEFYGTTPSDQE